MICPLGLHGHYRSHQFPILSEVSSKFKRRLGVEVGGSVDCILKSRLHTLKSSGRFRLIPQWHGAGTSIACSVAILAQVFPAVLTAP